ncbi:methyltransferase domain-containing protein [Microbacterium sp. VKM Ac-2870]|uniref:class I SAM-dependent methyltransferase n=1 Tax=Microbacterium sp. VKM Ac-2870 TaxID=2783825 RepID=UPI00188B55E3|nr:class I SAM-dependent methyltransferase [Microbacterium sp. VKM Ac-2870]MBF4561490.1 methyltransferase domain-containing protein [Microbacterium sp. VKM Ac-2870]
MERAELTALLTAEGLRLVDELGAIDSPDDVTRTVSRLRAAGLSPELVSAAVGQARLRTRARRKFGEFGDRMLFTRAGLEQATRLSVGARHAGRFRDAGLRRVADLGCGIGGDALALAGIGIDVVAVDADETTAALAAYNLAPFGDSATVRHARAEEVPLDDVDAVWLDPARRTAGHSETARVAAGEWSPPLDWVFALAARMPAGIKLGPAFDRALIPDDAEAQWISVDGSTIELVVWTGVLARPGVRRAALVIRADGAAELTADGDAEDAEVRPLGAYVHEPEGAVIRARLIGEVARSLDAGMIAPGIAYLTSDAEASNPFVQSFRVREQLPTDVKALARTLREREIGTLEIKKRGVDIDPAALRTKLKLRGPHAATLILTRAGSSRVALLADRV